LRLTQEQILCYPIGWQSSEAESQSNEVKSFILTLTWFFL